MDRRMNRGNMGNVRNVSPYRSHEPVNDNISGRFEPDDHCRKDKDHCEDHFNPDRFPIGMCYVPWQCFRDLYENEFVALANGTLFKELDYDWYGRGCK